MDDPQQGTRVAVSSVQLSISKDTTFSLCCLIMGDIIKLSVAL